MWRAMGLVLLTIFACAGGGCGRALFPEEQPRSPYQRYNSLRGRNTQTTEMDAFGRERPNLRDRLRPLDAP